MDTYIHPSAVIGDNVTIGDGTKIWHFCHIMAGASLGRNCVAGQNVMIAAGVKIGDGCKIQNNVSIYQGVELGDEVFCGPSVVFTNVKNPRAGVSRKDEFLPTKIRRGVTLGANATIVCGIEIAEYTMVGAGALLNKDTQAYGLYTGVPAHWAGWTCRCGETLLYTTDPAELFESKQFTCERCGSQYQSGPDGLAVL